METEKKYKVVRYFDDYPDKTIARNLTYDEAKIIRDSNNTTARVYVSYEIRDNAE